MYMEPATPSPRPRPSFPWRSFQAEAFSTSSRHLRKPLEVIFWPFTVSTNSPMKLRRRTSMGSIPSFSAASSSATSKAKRGWTDPCPRLGPQGGLFVYMR